MISAGTYNAPNWVDLSTPDVKTSSAFYAALFGWKLETVHSPMGDYTIGKVGKNQVGGMMTYEGPEMWTVFVYVEDADDAVQRARDAGGTVLQEPSPIPGDARVAVVADPTGAMLGLIEGPRPVGTYLSHEPGRVAWVDLMTRDPMAAAAFYEALFGWKRSADTDYTSFLLDDEPVAGMMAMPGEVPPEAPSYWGVYFAVGDCARAAEKAKELGGSVIRAPTTFGHGEFAVLGDPTGVVFNVMTWRR